MIGLVACCKTKLGHTAPARELYTSPLFRMSLAWAERHCERVYVLSAKHGLVPLGAPIAPYDLTLATATKVFRVAWGIEVVRALIARHGTNLNLCALAGAAYVEPIARAGRELRVHATIREPLGGMQIGERLAWLSTQNKHFKPADLPVSPNPEAA